MGTEDGGYPAMGFHTRGEMAGFWTPPIKLVDGVWFGIGGAAGVEPSWLKADRYTYGWGYQRMGFAPFDVGGQQVRVRRVDVAPGGVRAGLIGLRFTSDAR